MEDRSLAFEETTGIWWLLYLENEGLFCLLCRKHNVDNPSNRSKIFNAAPSVRFRKEAIIEHSKGKQHQSAVQAEMKQRVSVFHRQVEERELVKDEDGFDHWECSQGIRSLPSQKGTIIWLYD